MKLINRCKSKHSNCNQSICVPVSTVRAHQCLHFPPPFNAIFVTFVYFDLFFFLNQFKSWYFLDSFNSCLCLLIPIFSCFYIFKNFKSFTFNLFQYFIFSLFSSRSFIYVVFAFNFSFDSL